MKKLFILFASVLILSSCAKEKVIELTEDFPENAVKPDFVKEELDKKFGTDEIYIVKTYMETPDEELSKYLEQNKIFTKMKHYQLSDGTWKTDNYNYKYKLILTGRMNNAAKDSTFILLSNIPDITFDAASKAFGYSSNMSDYFDPEDVVFVAIG